MNRHTFALAAASLFAGTMALADAFSDKIVADLQSQGFDRIEIKNGPTQTKVEATDGTRKLEVVFDRASGGIVKQEVETLRPGEHIHTGVRLRTEEDDFVDIADDRREDDDDRRRDRDDDDRRDRDDDDDDRRDRDDDNDDDHDDDDDNDDRDEEEDDDDDDDDDRSGPGGGD